VILRHNSGDVKDGIVVENRGALFEVMVDGRVVRCLLRGKLKKVTKGHRRYVATPVAAGDRVKVAMLEPGRGVIEEVLPRESGLSRTAAGSAPLQQTLVANVDQAVIVFAAADPRPDLFLLDRFLVAAIASELEPLVCINKCDLVDGEPLRARFAVYRQCGFRLLFTSAENGGGVEALKAALRDRRSVLCGPSGVGKSSLLNAVAPGLSLRVGDVGGVTHKGRHTTTSITLLELPFGGWVADTAGLRQFAFVRETCETCPCDRPMGRHGKVANCPIKLSPNSVVKRKHIAAAFPELHPYLGKCKYSNCSHRDEQGCAMREAVASGDIDTRRLRSYLQLVGGET
jgi:ribosome biogenesis GTPase